MRNKHSGLRYILSTTVAVAAVAASAGAALAGGFAIREQSAHFQGSSFAGNGAGGALSSMFWNPAAVGQFNGINTESSYSILFPSAEITPQPGSTGFGLGSREVDIGLDAIVPSSYLSYQLSPSLVLGFSFGAPYGLSTKPDSDFWAGMTQARKSKIETYNLQTALAWRVTPTFIVAAGLQVEHMEGTLKGAAAFAPGAPSNVIHGDDTAFGWTLGALWNAAPGTTIGLGFRSSIEHNLEGTFRAGPIPFASIEAGLKTPETVTLSLRQALGPRWTGLATVEWANWSRLDKLDVECTSAPCSGALITSLPLGWHDGWFFALGAEYAWSPNLTLRGGAAYEISPIQGADERPVRLPDSDRIWASLGATYQWSEKISFDLAYTHIFAEDSRISRFENGMNLIADVEASVDIISAGVKIKFGDDAPLPLK